MKQIPEKFKNSFCILPWLHTHANANASRRLCCVASPPPEEFQFLSHEEFKNSSWTKAVRKQMLSGELPEVCSGCKIPNKEKSFREVMNQVFAEHVSQCLTDTDENGFYSGKTRFIDYRIDTCNLACKMCNTGSSTKFQSLTEKLSDREHMRTFGMLPQKIDRTKVKTLHEQQFQEVIKLINTEPIERFYFAGGEPLADVKHLELLKKIIELKKADSIELHYNTNLNLPKTLIENWCALLPSFRRVSISVSVDGTNEVYNYIRTFGNFTLLSENLKLLKKFMNEKISVQLDFTANSVNLFYLESMAQFAIDQQLQLIAKVMIGSRYSLLLKPEMMLPEIRQKIQERWNTFFSRLPAHEQKYVESFNGLTKLLQSLRNSSGLIDSFVLERFVKYEEMFGADSKGAAFKLLSSDQLGRQWLVGLGVPIEAQS